MIDPKTQEYLKREKLAKNRLIAAVHSMHLVQVMRHIKLCNDPDGYGPTIKTDGLAEVGE